jgi:hypothetical protein
LQIDDLRQGSGLRARAETVWNNPLAKKQLFKLLKKLDDPNAKDYEKSLKGFKNLTELKNSPDGPRVFLYRKNQETKVVGFCMRSELKETLKQLKAKFK